MEQMTTIPMPVCPGYYVITKREITSNTKEYIIMAEITEEEEAIIENEQTLNTIKNGTKLTIDPYNIYCYGEINFTDSNDLDDINTFDFLDYLGGVGIKMPSDYDYEHHVCVSPIKTYRFRETWKPADLCQYAHGVLGKPKRVVIYKLIGK